MTVPKSYEHIKWSKRIGSAKSGKMIFDSGQKATIIEKGNTIIINVHHPLIAQKVCESIAEADNFLQMINKSGVFYKD